MTKTAPDLPVTHLERKQVKWETRFEIIKRVLILLTLILVTACLSILVTLASRNRQTLDAINSCTHPGQECYQNAQKSTAQAVASINQVVIFAAYCAARQPHQSVTRIQQCVINRLATEGDEPS